MAERETEPVVHYCGSCQTTRAFRVTFATSYLADNEAVPEEVTLAFCRTRGQPALFGREYYGEDEQGDNIWSGFYRLYPAEERAVHYKLPKLVKEAYDEAVRCERGQAWMATVTMVRRALEAIAKDYVPRGRGDLFRALAKMHADGAISDEMKRWADDLRTWGNLGAHATTRPIAREDAKAALDSSKPSWRSSTS